MSTTSFLNQYQAIRKRTFRLLEVAPPDQLDFSYKKGKFSIADQIRHIAAIERHMFAETLLGRKSIYRGCGPELGDDYQSIMEFFHRAHRETCDIIANLSDEDLRENVLTPTAVAISRMKWLQLLAEHEIHHRAQIYIYLNMLGIKTPPMYGLTSEELIRFSKP